MDYIKEFGKLIDLAEKQRREIATLKSRYEKAADEIKASYNSGLLGDRGLQETLVMMQEEETRKITLCQESILQAGADVLRIAKLETIPNAKMLDSDIMAILNSGIDLTRDDWESYIHEQRHNPTMVRALRSFYEKHPLTVTENSGGLIDTETTQTVALEWPMLPSECAEIFCKFAEFLARNVENNVCPPEYADVKSYVNARALKALGEIDRVDAEAAAKVFPVKMAETVRGYDIW